LTNDRQFPVTRPPDTHREPPCIGGSLTREDRDYLTMMYAEHAEEARQHETLRATATGLFVALIAGLLAFAVGDPERMRVAGVLICVVSFLGGILNHKHYERNRLHVHVLCGVRNTLEKGLTSGVSEISEWYRADHEIKNPTTSRRIKLHILWLIVYIITFIFGVLMLWLDPIRLSRPAPLAFLCTLPALVASVGDRSAASASWDSAGSEPRDFVLAAAAAQWVRVEPAAPRWFAEVKRTRRETWISFL
jgi:hypothetical protein